jgi:alginate O-acetyltransferase complex protein AlgI
LLFNSLDFALFFPAVFIAYALARGNWTLRKALLLGASYLFYMAWNPPFVVLLMGSTLLDFTAGRRIAATQQVPVRRAWLLASCVGNLGVLAFFKYSDFLLSNLWWAVGPQVEYPDLVRDLVLPLGISFYTFQSLGYTIDVYRGRQAPARSALDFAVYVAFFPQLVAGPIIRCGDFLPQLRDNSSASAEEISSGLNQMVRGFAKKLLGADLLAVYVDAVYDAPGSFGALNHLLAVYAYAFQIYFDFSGYTDIAIGAARTLGFRVPPNFRLPYLACGPADFWTRWHISLSSWLRDYLYIPLGGSRGSPRATYLNLAITMLLGGLWHGAAWGFVMWGAFHGAWLAIHRALFRERTLFAVPRWVSRLATFHLVCIGWVFFRAQTLTRAGEVWSGFTDLETPVQSVDSLVLVVLAVGFASHLLGSSTRLAAAWKNIAVDVQVLYWASVSAAAFVFTSQTAKFIYFQF